MTRHDSQACLRMLWVRAFSCAVMSAPFLLAGFGCASHPSSDRVVVESGGDGSPISHADSVRISQKIDAILVRSEEGEREAAVDMLVELAKAEEAPLRYLPFHVTDEEFRVLPAAERDARFPKMTNVQRIAGRITLRALKYALAGESAKSEEVLLALKRLAHANQGPGTLSSVDRLGKALERLADSYLAQFDHHTAQAPAPIPPADSTQGSHDVDAILDRYSEGAHDAAIDMLVALAKSDAASLRYPPLNLTDEEFRALSKSKRDAITGKMRLMQKLGRKITERALKYALSGEAAKSEEVLLALKRLAQANQGPELFKTADQTGQALEYFADVHLAQFDRRKYPMPTSYLGRPISAIKE